ncbi:MULTISPECIES: MinD/ParA family protein [Allobacillus]|uniref:MinD/ParA family protein n=1 Tax=Allobacillus salarius TaxID=1955272 RepID=A0A556PS00_9BACI|nr:MinD/ParA family protein [Allobacillus salarius]TSJ67168.1 MinD/ParA family protein [Allobacillus salarius]
MVNDQASKLRELMSNQTQENRHQAKAIAIFSGKGGVGKSNFAINFGLCLANRKKKVLLIDLDIGMGNVDVLLGASPAYSIVEMLENKMGMFDIIESRSEYFSFIAAGTSLSRLFELNSAERTHFIEQLQGVISFFDYILLDLGAGMTKNHLAFLEAADESIVITTPEPTAITDSYAAMKHLLIESDNQSIHLSLLINRTTKNTEGWQVYQRLREVTKSFLNYQLRFAGSLPDDPTVTESVKKQVPFIESFPKSRISKQLDKLVTQYEQLESKKPKQSSTFMEKMKTMLFR